MTFYNKLERLSLTSLMFEVSPGAYPRKEQLQGASLGYVPALPANIRLG
jgi:hypothetical protein